MAWNQLGTDQVRGMVAAVVKIPVGGETVSAYVAQPEGDGPYPGLVVLHHAPGWGRILPRVLPMVRRAWIHRGLSEPVRTIGTWHTPRGCRRRTRGRRRLG